MAMNGDDIFSRSFVTNEERRGLLNFDLNVAPPEEGDFDSLAAGNGGEIRPAAAEAVASVEDYRLDLSGIESHWSKLEKKGLCENMNFDSELEIEERERKVRGWKTLLEVAGNALREHEENVKHRKRKPSREAELGELGGELCRRTSREKIDGHRRQSFAAGWIEETAAAMAAPAVVRSTRGRAVAMPNKYRDSVLDAASEFSRHNKSGKFAAVVSTKRKFR